MTAKRMTKQYISILGTNMSSFEFRLRKIYETRNYHLDETKHKDLMSEKYKKTCKNLSYVEHLFILLKHLLVVFQFLHLLY